MSAKLFPSPRVIASNQIVEFAGLGFCGHRIPGMLESVAPASVRMAISLALKPIRLIAWIAGLHEMEKALQGAFIPSGAADQVF
ncbi:MAG: hypothetical protein Q8Q28_12460 [Pseudomonadota bacterium]|nr:hypothetical protein [Pseudomonadota bacterium]